MYGYKPFVPGKPILQQTVEGSMYLSASELLVRVFKVVETSSNARLAWDVHILKEQVQPRGLPLG